MSLQNFNGSHNMRLDSASEMALHPIAARADTTVFFIVPADEAVCLANGSGVARDSEVAWHVRRGAVAPAEVLQASNL